MPHEQPAVNEEGRKKVGIHALVEAVTGTWKRDDSAEVKSAATETASNRWRSAHQAEAKAIDEALSMIINNRNDNEIVAFLQEQHVNIPALAKEDAGLLSYMDQFKQDIYYNHEQEEQFSRIMDKFLDETEKPTAQAA